MKRAKSGGTNFESMDDPTSVGAGFTSIGGEVLAPPSFFFFIIHQPRVE